MASEGDPTSSAASADTKQEKAASKTPKPAKAKGTKAKKTSGASVTKGSAKASKTPRQRKHRPFPNCSFEDALEIATTMQDISSGMPTLRLTLFDHMKKSPESSRSRELITNSGKYGLTSGSYQSEKLELTKEGALATSDEASLHERTRARFQLAVVAIEPFNAVYQKLVNNKLPSKAVLADMMRDAGVPDEHVEEAVDTMILNCQYVGILKTLSGAERFISIDHLLESLPSTASRSTLPSTGSTTVVLVKSSVDFDKTCFYVTPIGEDKSEHRQHSDMFLGSIVEPALEPFELEVIRADAIDKPGVITKQVIEYLLKSKLVIADLSYHNPNVFYELAIRHAARLPTVQIIRSQDRIPFDVNPQRTIDIDCSSIYALLPQVETYKSRIANHVRRALEDADASDNPITLFWPSLKVSL
jgi:hypothetical protein